MANLLNFVVVPDLNFSEVIDSKNKYRNVMAIWANQVVHRAFLVFLLNYLIFSVAFIFDIFGNLIKTTSIASPLS